MIIDNMGGRLAAIVTAAALGAADEAPEASNGRGIRGGKNKGQGLPVCFLKAKRRHGEAMPASIWLRPYAAFFAARRVDLFSVRVRVGIGLIPSTAANAFGNVLNRCSRMMTAFGMRVSPSAHFWPVLPLDPTSSAMRSCE